MTCSSVRPVLQWDVFPNWSWIMVDFPWFPFVGSFTNWCFLTCLDRLALIFYPVYICLLHLIAYLSFYCSVFFVTPWFILSWVLSTTYIVTLRRFLRRCLPRTSLAFSVLSKWKAVIQRYVKIDIRQIHALSENSDNLAHVHCLIRWLSVENLDGLPLSANWRLWSDCVDVLMYTCFSYATVQIWTV